MLPIMVQSTRKNIPLSHFSVPFLPAMSYRSEVPCPSIAQDADTQSESLLFTRLPGELRNYIYTLALTSGSPIIDPSIPPTHTQYAKSLNLRTPSHQIPDLSTPLLRTCKLIYAEVLLAPLYASNTFRFTTSFSAERFLSRLPNEYRLQIQDVEVDLREVADVHPAVDREWVSYLSWKPVQDAMWASRTGSLRVTVPNIKTLRINIEGWKHTESMRSVAVLREVMQGPKNLERVVLVGIDGSELLFGAREKYLALWGTPIFVGVMRFARLAGMLEWMADCVKGDKEKMVVMWAKDGHRVTLEIMSTGFFKRHTGRKTPDVLNSAKLDPRNGCCTLLDYELTWRSGEWPNGIKS